MPLTEEQQARLDEIRKDAELASGYAAGYALKLTGTDVPWLLDLVAELARTIELWDMRIQRLERQLREYRDSWDAASERRREAAARVAELEGEVGGLHETVAAADAERDRLRAARDNVLRHNTSADRILTDALKAAGVPPEKRPTLVAAAAQAAKLIRRPGGGDRHDA